MTKQHTRSGLVTLCVTTALPSHELHTRLTAAYAKLENSRVAEVHVEDDGLVTLCVDFTSPYAVGEEIKAVKVDGVTVSEVHIDKLRDENE